MSAAVASRAALIALHYQNDVLHPEGKIRVGLGVDSPVRQNVLSAAQDLLGRARNHHLPIIHVRIAFRPDYADLIVNAPIFRNVKAIGAVAEGSWGAQFHDALAPDARSEREFIVKHTRINAFYGTQLEEILRALKIDRLLIAGVATHSVVESTVRHAVDMGYEVSVASSACAAADPAVHRASLASMAVIANILDSDSLLRGFFGQS